MSLTRVQATGKVLRDNGATVALTFASPPSVGNGIVVLVSEYASGAGPSVLGCVDNRGNSYTLAASRAVSQMACLVYVCAAAAASAAPFTITVTGAGNTYWVASAVEVSGGGGPGLSVDQSVTNSAVNTAVSSGTTAPLTADEGLLAAVCAFPGTLTSLVVQVVSPVWIQEYEELNWSLHAVGEGDTRVVTGVAGTPVSGNWTANASTSWVAALVAFKGAAVAAVERVTPFVWGPL